jgi:hypothetical protein
VDAGLLDVLHDAADHHVESPSLMAVDVDLDRIVEEAVEQHRDFSLTFTASRM